MSKKKTNIPPEKIEQYEKLVATVSDVPVKGAMSRYTSWNGNMFSFISKEGEMGLRLSKEDREQFIKKFDSQLIVQHNTVMKEYVAVSDELLADTKKLKKYFQLSFDYVQTLKPKPTKKKPKS